jgi:hypothetical protein
MKHENRKISKLLSPENIVKKIPFDCSEYIAIAFFKKKES